MSDNTAVAVAGSSGLIGSALVSVLRAQDRPVIRLVRRPPTQPGQRCWNPEAGDLDPAVLQGVSAVVNLCGAPVAGQRWSGAYKQILRDSRITPTEVLASACATAGVPTLVNGSAIGFYGDTGARMTDEKDPAGGGFLAGLCRDWEAATAPAADAGLRVVRVRTGHVLSPSGGILGALRPLFNLGLGAKFGGGRQYISWISLEDTVRALLFALTCPDLAGPVNLTAPNPVSNAEFTTAYGKAIGRPTPWRVPGFAAKRLVGEFAEEGLLTGQRVVPTALRQAGFEFHHDSLDQALDYATDA